eukprot:TRINITY_DN59856_c0_g1_i1.p1 TRINITY_DN59856_c0_g1~~TRINITY_DN59856_c0_g1_i1.p1  ORF type:complete len:224 (-),score=11.37 TRINITY_DN59856_c0_g1_i1:114-764(-)
MIRWCCAFALLLGVFSLEVCLPPAFSWRRGGQFIVAGKKPGEDVSTEFVDTTNGNFRFEEFDFVDGKQYFAEIIIKNKEKRMWTIRTETGTGVIKCTCVEATLPPTSTCLQKNATVDGTIRVGGADATIYSEQASVSGAMVYQEVILTTGDNAPVLTRTFDTRTSVYSHNLYYNYRIDVPASAFDVPSFCPTQPSGKITVEEIRETRPKLAEMLRL